MAEKWERHNAPNGEHIWCGQEHIADITGKGQNEVAKMAVTAHNTCQKINPENPLEVVEGMEEAIGTLIIARGFLACYEDKAHKEIADIVRQATAKVKVEGDK